MEEIWKDIPGFEGIYQISNAGNVKSFIKNGKYSSGKAHLLKPTITRGYASVALWKGKDGKKTVLVHRLVADAFVPNPNNYREVNHKDENKLNNNAENLEWCTRAYNMSYGTARFRQGISRSRPVEQLTIDGISIAVYCSIPIAAKINNLDESSIHKCLSHKRKFAGGYMWRLLC